MNDTDSKDRASTIIASGDNKANAIGTVEDRPIRIPDEFLQAAKATLSPASFPMTGAQVFARLCKEEGLAALFCCPGNYSIVSAYY